MNESITFHLHTVETTTVGSTHGKTEYGSWCSLAIGPVEIFASPELLRKIADEANRAALIAEGWSRPPETPADPPVFEYGALKSMPIPAVPSEPEPVL